MAAKSGQLNVRLTPSDLEMLNEINTKHRISQSEMIRGLLEAALAFYREHGWFGFPVKIEPTEPWLKAAVEDAASKRKPRQERGSKSA